MADCHGNPGRTTCTDCKHTGHEQLVVAFVPDLDAISPANLRFIQRLIGKLKRAARVECRALVETDS